ncbi:D-alanine--poly(phosphoribitol) ligase subunit 1 [Striga asiatica]|uniref:D-alanine--poly(Phosphoribitol) ligase subunit 1 n=1 Tax=Striga asiatica TaxID=4170 RepID=A0A5A7QMI8_STRAF|nr:D-alanine--poly(phosphoribitol) ligase subunit 1 [Striga asiatica]
MSRDEAATSAESQAKPYGATFITIPYNRNTSLSPHHKKYLIVTTGITERTHVVKTSRQRLVRGGKNSVALDNCLSRSTWFVLSPAPTMPKTIGFSRHLIALPPPISIFVFILHQVIVLLDGPIPFLPFRYTLCILAIFFVFLFLSFVYLIFFVLRGNSRMSRSSDHVSDMARSSQMNEIRVNVKEIHEQESRRISNCLLLEFSFIQVHKL